MTITRWGLVLSCFVTLAVSSLQGQTGQGVVEGTVADASGALIAGAAVTLTNNGTGITQSGTTSGGGVYRFPLVEPGTYTLSIKAPGFVERQVKQVVVNASQTTPINAQLSIASASTTIEVTTQESLVQTTDSQLATTINPVTIQNTPILSRNVYDLSFVAPTVTQGMNGNAAAGGVRESGTGYILNGADNNNNFNEGGRNVTPPLESVSEVTVLTNSMSAQYGRAAGAVVSAAQKSGTNEFHGVAYEFNRNRFFAANDFLNNRAGAPRPQFNRNQFGGELDGPIIKDKTFFAFAYDRVTLHTTAISDQATGNPYSSIQVMTPTELATLQAQASPLAKQILQAYPQLTSTTPCPNQATTAPASIGHVGCIAVSDPLSDPINSYYGRIDQNFGPSNRLSAVANFTREDYVDALGGGHPTSTVHIPYLANRHYHNLALVDTHTFSPTLVNEFTLAHNRHSTNDQEGNGKSTLPDILIDGTNNGLGLDGIGYHEGTLVENFTQDRWQVQNNTTVIAGRHSVKFGGSYQYGILYRNWDLGAPGQYEFDNVFGAAAAATLKNDGSGRPVLNADGSMSGAPTGATNFQNDFPYYQETSIDPTTGSKANAYRHYTSKDMGVFINDEWKATRNLTINLGLRWERFGAPQEVNLRLAQFTDDAKFFTAAQLAADRVIPQRSMWHTNDRDFAPRVGFAWDVYGNGKMAVRGSYGIFYDRIFDNVWSNSAWNPPFYQLVDLNNQNADATYYSLPPSIGATFNPNRLPRASLRTMERFLKDSSDHAYFFSVERQFAHDFLFRASYQGSFGRHLPQLENLNRYDGLRYNSKLSLTLPNSLYNGYNYRANNVNSNYNSLVAELQKRFSHGLQFQFSYIFSKLLDYGSDLFQGETGRQSNSQPYYSITNASRRFDYGLGAYDHKDSFKLNFVYDLPLFREQKGIMGQALGGWQLSSFTQIYSGHPLEVYTSRPRFVGNALDANGIPENLGGDYNLDGVANDRPNYIGLNAHSFYSDRNAADGIFKDVNKIGCGYPGAASTNVAACNKQYGVVMPNAFFAGPGGSGVKFGKLGRNVFRGPWFYGLNASLSKSFKLTERIRLQVRGDAFNLLNHANFDNIVTNLNSSNFGRSNQLVPDSSTSIADPGNISRRFQLGARLSF